MKSNNLLHSITTIFCISLLVIELQAHAQQDLPALMVTGRMVEAPVLKRMPVNPLLQLRIYSRGEEVALREVQATLNPEAVQDIEKLEIYDSENEPLFSTAHLVTSMEPAGAHFAVPLSLSLKPGIHYLWFSATLKKHADLHHSFDFRVSRLVDGQGNYYFVHQTPTKYKKRIGVAVRKGGDDDVNAYRIPGLVTTEKGTLIAVYDVRYNSARDLPGHINIGMSRSTDGGQSWEPMKIIMDMGAPQENNGVGDPSILIDPVTHKIWVAALWSKGNHSIAGSGPGLSPEESGQLVLVSSGDDGLTWSEPVNITAQVKKPQWKILFQGPGRGITMRDGTLVFPAQFWDEKGIPNATIIYSMDHGRTWQCGTAARSNTTESQVIETTPGTLMLNMRDNRGSVDPMGGFRSVAITTDMGRTWKEHPTSYSALPDPVCMGSLIADTFRVGDRRLKAVLFSNPNSSFTRNMITIKGSPDGGETWPKAYTALIDERRCYGYSALTRINADTIGLLYEGEKDLYFVWLPVSDLFHQKAKRK